MNRDIGSKSMPKALDAERAVLGAILLDNRLILQVMDKLNRSDFYSAINGELYAFMLGLHGDGVSIDPVTIRGKAGPRFAELGGGAYVAGLIDGIPRLGSAESYIRAITATAKLRKLIAYCENFIAEAFEINEGTGKFISECAGQLLSLDRRTSGADMRSMMEVAQEWEDEYNAVASGERAAGYMTGMMDLDYQIGGMGNGHHILIGGDTGGGKSALAGAIAKFQAKTLKVAYISMEMTGTDLFRRMLAAETGIPVKDIRLANCDATGTKRLANCAGDLAMLDLYIDDSPRLKVEEIATKLRRMKAEIGIDTAFIDHGHILKLPPRAFKADFYEEAGIEFKGLAKELGIGLCSLWQLNRDHAKRDDPRPTRHDFKWASGLEQSGDVVLLPYRPNAATDYEWSADGAHNWEHAELIIDKNRENKPTILPVVFIRNEVRFVDQLEFEETYRRGGGAAQPRAAVRREAQPEQVGLGIDEEGEAR